MESSGNLERWKSAAPDLAEPQSLVE